MKAIIPVAGVGTRLKPLTNNIPKVLINLAGKPMLFHLIDELIKIKELDTIILIVGYLGDKVKEAVAKQYGPIPTIKFEFVEQKDMLGLGHAVHHAKPHSKNDPVLIILGDTIFEFDLQRFLSSEYSAIGYKDVEDVSRFGIIESENGFITRMIEKPQPGVTQSKSAIAGLYFVKESEKLFDSIEHIIASNIKTNDEYQLTDALQDMVANGEKFIPFEIQNWFDCGKPETLLSTNNYLIQRDCKEEVWVSVEANVQSSEIKNGTLILEGARVIDSVLDNCIVYENAVIENSRLENCIVGNGERVSGNHQNEMIAESDRINF